MKVEIWHNPRCRKSREALAWLRERGIEPRIYEYLKQPPTPERLAAVIALLGIEPEALMRKNEREYKEHVRGRALDDAEKIAQMCAHPRIIERPIVIVDDTRAVIARPAERIEAIL